MNEPDHQTLARARAIYDEIASEDKALSEAFLPLMTETLPTYELVSQSSTSS
jgi:hypothetical protein